MMKYCGFKMKENLHVYPAYIFYSRICKRSG